MLNDARKVLIVAPHPDDEVLGAGGTMARLASEAAEVHVVIVTRGQAPRFSKESVESVHAEAIAAHRMLNVTETHFLDFPAAELDRVPHADLNARLGDVIQQVAPDTVFCPFGGDIHRDHKLVFESVLVACRPRGSAVPKRLLAYETLSETNWGASSITPIFAPNVFVDIGATLETKIKAFGAYVSQQREFPDERSIEAIRALAVSRGAAVYREAAEAFVLVRLIV